MNLYDIVSLTVELLLPVDWTEELGDALSQPIAWESAISQSEQPEDDTSLPVGVYTRQLALSNLNQSISVSQ